MTARELSQPTGRLERWSFARRGGTGPDGDEKPFVYLSSPHRTWFYARAEAAQALRCDPSDLATVRP